MLRSVCVSVCEVSVWGYGVHFTPRMTSRVLYKQHQNFGPFSFSSLHLPLSGGFNSPGLPDAHHPDLVAYYKFDEGQGYTARLGGWEGAGYYMPGKGVGGE